MCTRPCMRVPLQAEEVVFVTRLYLIEGIPGAGKTTLASAECERLEKEGRRVFVFPEGSSHPADMAWQALLTREEYEEFVASCRRTHERINSGEPFSSVKAAINARLRVEGESYILAYTSIAFPSGEYWENCADMPKHELGDARVPLERFKAIHLERWSRFAQNARQDAAYIFDCAFLQNHVFELMGFYEKDWGFILDYLRELIGTVAALEPEIVYIKVNDVRRAVEQTAAERVSDKGSWIDGMCEWVAGTPYGKSHALSGREGVCRFLEERESIDLYCLERLGLPVRYVERSF